MTVDPLLIAGAIVIIILLIYWFRPQDNYKLLYFYKPTCPACVAFKPIWESITKQLQRNCIPKEIDTTTKEGSSYSDNFEIKAVPTLILLAPNGERYKFNEGSRDTETVLAFIKKHMNA
jgi:thioredoxin-like negative regulator of GroEL